MPFILLDQNVVKQLLNLHRIMFLKLSMPIVKTHNQTHAFAVFTIKKYLFNVPILIVEEVKEAANNLYKCILTSYVVKAGLNINKEN